MKKTRGIRKSIATALVIGSFVVITVGTGIASAYKSSPYGGDEFTVTGYGVGVISTYCWITGNHGSFRCSAQKGDGELKRSAVKAYGTATANAFGTGTSKGWYYNIPGTYTGKLGAQN